MTISASMSKDDMIGLKQALINGLNQGLTINEIKEILVQLYAYVGFPRSLNGLSAFKDLLEERQREGLTDTVGSTSTPLPTNISALALGTKIQTKVVGKPRYRRHYGFFSCYRNILILVDTIIKSNSSN